MAATQSSRILTDANTSHNNLTAVDTRTLSPGVTVVACCAKADKDIGNCALALAWRVNVC